MLVYEYNVLSGIELCGNSGSLRGEVVLHTIYRGFVTCEVDCCSLLAKVGEHHHF